MRHGRGDTARSSAMPRPRSGATPSPAAAIAGKRPRERAQADAIRGAALSLKAQRGTTVVGEMGTGKTFIAALDARDIRLPLRLAISPRHALGMKAEPTGPRPGRSPHPCGALGLPVVANQCGGAGAERHRGTVESGARSGGRRRSSSSALARCSGRHRLQRNRGSGDGEHH